MTDDSSPGSAKVIDLRGLACPEPVLRTKKLLDDQSVQLIDALVSDTSNVQNLERLARSQKVSFEWQAEGEFFRVLISRAGTARETQKRKTPGTDIRHSHKRTSPSLANLETKGSEIGTVILITKESFGEGDPDFSTNLLNIFLQTVLQSGHRPKAILLANTGVKLLAPNSPFAQVLKNFLEQGTEVLACGLCVEFYGLKKVIAQEQITNMFAICEYLFAADKVLSP
ncbi:MAG: sulfurtransferase-like selenium metabolism protein YedF [Candidatus Melainabacteria bacterium]|nr:MAG: sulfurtransferase-like selenium metabolism protein YedF [Candidatus Melainabacteria bacterium]